MIFRNTLISVIIVSTLFSCEEQQLKKPNIIVFIADDMGYGDPQSYTAVSKIPTPNIDKLASQGMRFTDAHSSASVCTPTRYSILTGRYAWRTRLKRGVLGPYNSPLIEEDRLTIPKMLKEKGYETAIIGKWHLGMNWATNNNSQLPDLWDRSFDASVIDHNKKLTKGPLTIGFDYYFGLDVPNFPPYIFIENDSIYGNPTVQKPDTLYGTPGKMLPGWKLNKILPTLTEKAVDYINNHATKKSEKPLYLHFTSTAPHTPIVPSKEYIGKSKAGPYGDFVYETDHALGAIRNALKENGMLENTIIIFTSDNGSPARAGDPYVHGPDYQVPGSVITKFGHNPNAPWRGMKGDIYEGGHRVPFVVSWPKRIAKNKISNEPVSSIDIMSTVGSIVGYEIPNNAGEDSYDLSQLLFGEKLGVDHGRKAIREAIVHHSTTGNFSIRQGKWKMIPKKGSGGWGNAKSVREAINEPEGQLYNLEMDPVESNNLWNEHPEIVEQLKLLLEKYKKDGRSKLL